MIQDIIVNLPLKPSRPAAISYAVSVASAFKAHLSGVAFVYEPILPPVDMGVSVPSSFLEEARAESQERTDAAVAAFEEQARREGIGIASHKIDVPVAAAPGRFAELARRFDLAIVSQAEPDQDTVDDLIAEAALFESGRPILMVPYIQKTGMTLERVAVCWDGGRPAARAIGDAMPFLRKAKMVDLIVVENDRPKSEDFPGIDIARHIARHGIKVDLKRLPMTTDVPTTILNFTSDAGTDLLVMGGYGHSRLREFILGGATRGILQSMTVPTLMSH